VCMCLLACARACNTLIAPQRIDEFTRSGGSPVVLRSLSAGTTRGMRHAHHHSTHSGGAAALPPLALQSLPGSTSQSLAATGCYRQPSAPAQQHVDTANTRYPGDAEVLSPPAAGQLGARDRDIRSSGTSVYNLIPRFSQCTLNFMLSGVRAHRSAQQTKSCWGPQPCTHCTPAH
jgi:hypothetical protein